MIQKLPFSTKQAARLLGVSISRLARAAWDQRFDPPEKGPGGAFMWTARDLERASWVLRHRGIDDVMAQLADGCGESSGGEK